MSALSSPVGSVHTRFSDSDIDRSVSSASPNEKTIVKVNSVYLTVIHGSLTVEDVVTRRLPSELLKEFMAHFTLKRSIASEDKTKVFVV